ncbi:hypothetical protein AUJ84_00475 [Candidatus Pacearchaeota archaeon CG1_02_32_132]|nr:MAG: hypothetical protein AUJ84_00475 [Candidatus Pacearchaeota archaeon CG1_02_32_132]
MVIRDKRGILKIIEATIAILLVFGFLLVIQVRNKDVSLPNFSEKIYDMLEEISKTPSLRAEVFNTDSMGFIPAGPIYDFVHDKVPSYLTIKIRVCDEIDKICSLNEFVNGEVYSGNRVIVPSVEEGALNTKKLSIFLYRNQDG